MPVGVLLDQHLRLDLIQAALRVEECAGQIAGVAVGVVQPQRLGVVLVVGADADGEQMQSRAGRHVAVGAQHDLPAVLGQHGQAESTRRSEFLEHQWQHGGGYDPGISAIGTLSAGASQPRLTSQRSTPCAPAVAA